MLDSKVILITGGTGSFGRRFAATVRARWPTARLVIFSRDEHKHTEMHRELGPEPAGAVRHVIGDVRDPSAVQRAFEGVDVVVHAAALKQIPLAESNPLEVIKTNVLGAANVIDAALACQVDRVIALSSDKAALPINVYGASKLCADKLFLSANDTKRTRFSVVRYGNVLRSRGSVLPIFEALRHTGEIPVTDPRMTRFWISLADAVDFTLRMLGQMHGGEVFVPKLPSMCVLDLARAVAPDCTPRIVGIRPGEKLHEVLIPEEEAHRTIEYQDRYIVHRHSVVAANGALAGGRPCTPGFAYTSDRNPRRLSVEQLRALLAAPVDR